MFKEKANGVILFRFQQSVKPQVECVNVHMVAFIGECSCIAIVTKFLGLYFVKRLLHRGDFWQFVNILIR